MAELKDSGTRREFAHSSQKIHSLCDETHTIDVQQAKPSPETEEKPTTICPTCRKLVTDEKGRTWCLGEFRGVGFLDKQMIYEGCMYWEPKEKGGKKNG